MENEEIRQVLSSAEILVKETICFLLTGEFTLVNRASLVDRLQHLLCDLIYAQGE